MHKLLMNFLLFALALTPCITFSQIEVLSPLEYILDFDSDIYENHPIVVNNTSDESISFKWSLEYNFEYSGDFYADIQDFNLHWHFDVLSSCEFNQPNELLPGETKELNIGIIKNEFYNNDPSIIPVIKFNLLSSPDCDSLINTIVFRGMTTSISFEEAELFQPYPNPVEDIIYIDNSNLENAEFKIVNINGQLMQEGKIASQQINVDGLDSGIIK